MNSDSKEINALSDGWELRRSKTNPGRQYYFHRQTGKSSWSHPQLHDKLKLKKTESPNKNQQNITKEETRNKSVKRKSDGAEAESSKKKLKNVTQENSGKKKTPKRAEKKTQPINKIDSHSKRILCNKLPGKRLSLDQPSSQSTCIKLTPKCASLNASTSKLSSLNPTPSKRTSLNAQKSTPTQIRGIIPKVSSTKNLANNRLSNLRAQLNEEARAEDNGSSPKINIGSPLQASNVTTPSTKPTKLAFFNASYGSTSNISPINTLYTTPTSSQFFAANKVIHSMKAQLSDEYSAKERARDTFTHTRDTEKGICSQIKEYPLSKHSSIPPRFSEANKLFSAMKSKLTSTLKDVKTFSSAKNRMETLRASISGDIDEKDLQDKSIDNCNMYQTPVKSFDLKLPQAPQACEAMEVEDMKESNEVAKVLTCQANNKDAVNRLLVLVVDTNVFIHELDFIKNVLNSHIKGYSEPPSLLVPWRVINELDRLKDNNNGQGSVCKRARAAMDYLYKSLPENGQIKGQSLRDANSHIYPCELPDDEILNCALQQAKRGKNVLLLSNDRNLCNKAVVNGVRCGGVAELRRLASEPRAAPAPLARRMRCENAIYQLLANILENEMRAMYDALWQRVVFKPPPWGLTDVLQCLLKHWMAVFREVFPWMQRQLADLKNAHIRLSEKDPKCLNESEVNSFQGLCTEVARKCQIIPEYMELAKLTLERLERASEAEDGRGRGTAVAAFEALWLVVSSYCAKLASAIGVPHSVEDKISAKEPLCNLIAKFPEFHTSTTSFVLALRGLLNPEEQSSMEGRIYRLEAAFKQCLQLTRNENRPSREDLREFCLTNRNMLEEATDKFAQLGQLLDSCRKMPQLVNSV